jgi:hypothetical protein
MSLQSFESAKPQELNMYRSFRLADIDWSELSPQAATNEHDSNKRVVKSALEQFITGEKIDGTNMKENWFPQIQADVFVSHAHPDTTDALRVASLLKDAFGLKCFIDSCVWGYAGDLLKQLDDKFCLNPGGETYNYQKRNGSTAHVHMMLSTALATMLDRSECVIFLETPASITSDDAAKKTKSPWLYLELGLLHILHQKNPGRILLESSLAKRAFANLQIEYAVELGNLAIINLQILKLWEKARQNSEDAAVHSLDLLYDLVPQSNRTR